MEWPKTKNTKLPWTQSRRRPRRKRKKTQCRFIAKEVKEKEKKNLRSINLKAEGFSSDHVDLSFYGRRIRMKIDFLGEEEEKQLSVNQYFNQYVNQ